MGMSRILASLKAALLFTVLLVLPFAPAAAQQLSARQVEVSATGVNEMDALMQAMVSAVNQVNGMRAGGLTVAVVAEAARGSGITSAGGLVRAAASVTQGAVKSYEVLESTSNPGGSGAHQWRVRIRATVATYNAGAQLKRLRLAVVPMQLSAGQRGNAAARRFGADFTEKLETLLTQSRRFAMLDRQFSDTVDRELAQYAGDDFSPEETARLGRKAGTDYLVVSRLTRYAVVDESIHMGMTGRTIPRKTAQASIQLRLIDVATGQIKYARDFDTGQHTARSDSAAEGMLGGMAAKASAEIINSIYPLAIVAADAAGVTLGQGGDTVKAGQRFQVFSLGQAMKDPYTGESLGRREMAIGLIEVTSVTDRVSTARILEGGSAIAAMGGKDMVVRAALPGAGNPPPDRAKTPGGARQKAKKPTVAGSSEAKSEDGDW